MGFVNPHSWGRGGSSTDLRVGMYIAAVVVAVWFTGGCGSDAETGASKPAESDQTEVQVAASSEPGSSTIPATPLTWEQAIRAAQSQVPEMSSLELSVVLQAFGHSPSDPYDPDALGQGICGFGLSADGWVVQGDDEIAVDEAVAALADLGVEATNGGDCPDLIPE